MSDLQIGLVVLGVLLILAVLGFNWWQDRRVRRRMQIHFPGSEHDPLLADPAAPRREPGMDGAVAPAMPAVAGQDDEEEADPACEVVIDIAFAEPLSGADLAAGLPRSVRDVAGKPVRIFGKTVDGAHRARLYEDERYVSIQLALLLANRSGPIGPIEWSHFWGKAQDLAERFDAMIEGPDQMAVIEQARHLDEFCASLDVQVGLNLVMSAPQPASAVMAVAREMGFAVEDGRLLWMSDMGLPRFSVARADGDPFDDRVGVDKLSMLLDVPLSPPDARPFGRMVQAGRDLAARLGAELVDDQGKPVHEGSEAAIDEHLSTLYAKLDQAGMQAGSERAARVFS